MDVEVRLLHEVRRSDSRGAGLAGLYALHGGGMSRRERISVAIRLPLTAALLVLVYGETGPWTTFALGLVALNNEVVVILFQHIENRLSGRRQA